MASVVPVYRRYRKNFSKIKEVLEISNLIEVQKRSYEQFLQANVDPEKREPVGLQAVFKTVFPIKDFYETASLDFVNYRLTEPKYDVEECLLRGMTYAAPIKVTVRLVVWDVNEETRAKSIKAVKEQEVYFGEIPLMTENGTFIVNGTERVIVSQLHRSPGVFFDQDKIKPHTGGKVFYYARIIPYRGSWIDFEFEIDPGPAVGGDSGIVEDLPSRVGLDLILIEKDARRTVELADDDPLRPVDDEGSILCHERDFTKINLLLLHRLDALGFRLLVHIPDDQAYRHLDRGRIGHSPQKAFFHIIFRFGETETDKFKRSSFIEIFDRKDSFKNSLKTGSFPLLWIHIGLQELFVGSFLNFNQIGDVQNLLDL